MKRKNLLIKESELIERINHVYNSKEERNQLEAMLRHFGFTSYCKVLSYLLSNQNCTIMVTNNTMGRYYIDGVTAECLLSNGASEDGTPLVELFEVNYYDDASEMVGSVVFGDVENSNLDITPAMEADFDHYTEMMMKVFLVVYEACYRYITDALVEPSDGRYYFYSHEGKKTEYLIITVTVDD